MRFWENEQTQATEKNITEQLYAFKEKKLMHSQGSYANS